MSVKRGMNPFSPGDNKRRKSEETYFEKTLKECKLTLKGPPEKCEASQETVHVIQDLQKSLQYVLPMKREDFLSDFRRACNNKETFEHYLYPNIVMLIDDTPAHTLSDSVIKILLNVSCLQNKLIQFIFDKVIEVLDGPDFGPWVKMLLKSLSTLNKIESPETLSTKLIDLLDVSSADKNVRLEIISAIPDIIGDQEHYNVASEMCRIMSEDRFLIPSILECLSYLCLSNEQFQRLQGETLKLLQHSNEANFPVFVKFLLTPGYLTESVCEETIKDLRRKLGWSSLIGSQQEKATSQILTAAAIRNSMLSSKVIAKAWIKVISNCKTSTEHEPIDIIILLILYSISDEKQRQVELITRKQVKSQILNKDLLNKAFEKFKPILQENIIDLISLTNSLLKETEPLIQNFVSHMYMVMFSELTDCSALIVAELLQLILNCKQSVLNALIILNKIASQKLYLMRQQSQQILTLLDRMDDMTVMEIRAVMDLMCALAYSLHNSTIRDDVDITIRKELGSSNLSIKKQGILAGIHAVKYLTKNSNKDTINSKTDLNPDDVSLNTITNSLPDLKEAREIIKLINRSTAQFPHMIVFYYDELYRIVQEATDMDEQFIAWLADNLTNDLQEHFLIDKVDTNVYGGVRVSMQFRLNEDSEVDEEWAVNIAGLTLGDVGEVSIELLSPLFQLVRALHYKNKNGDLSDIDALLGSAIVMPNLDDASMAELSEASVNKILECYIHCVNWIRELLNAFVSQKDKVLKPKILNRLAHLKDLEKKIEQIKDNERYPEHDDTTVNGKSQQSLSTQVAFTKNLALIHNINLRPLELTLFDLIQYELTPDVAHETELTFETLAYLLYYLNANLEKVLVPRIKRKTFLNKGDIVTYDGQVAEKQALTISRILPKIITHIDFITGFLDDHLVEERLELDTVDAPKIWKGALCLEYIYNVLTTYFKWIDFKSKCASLLEDSLRIVAKQKDKMVSMEDLLKTVANIYNGHEVYCLSISAAVSLIEFMKALQEHSTGPAVPSIVKNMSDKFLSKQWRTLDDQLEKGLAYNQGVDSLTKVYLSNNNIIDLKNFAIRLESDVDKAKPTFESIGKKTFPYLFRNLGAVLLDKIKSQMDGGLSDTEHVEMWGSVAAILKSMADIVTNRSNKVTASHFFKKSLPILNLLLSKGFPIFNKVFNENGDAVMQILKDFKTSTECLQNICSADRDTVLMKKIPAMKKALTDFLSKTIALLTANKCSEALKHFNVRAVHKSKRNTNTNKRNQQTVHADVTSEDCDDDLAEDDVDDLDEVNIFGGVSDLI